MRNFFEYIRTALFPLLVLYVPIGLFFLWGGLIMFMMGEWLLGLCEVGIALFPTLVLFVAYQADRKVESVWVRSLLIYGTWIIILWGGIFALSSVIGGASMAVTENPGYNHSREYGDLSFVWIVWGQPILLLFAWQGVRKLKKKE